MTNRLFFRRAIDPVVEHHGHSDVLVNKMVISQPVKTLQIGSGDYHSILDLSPRGPLLMSQVGIPTLRQHYLPFLSISTAQRRDCQRHAP
ncbi:hypothetical protein [Pantoea sp. AS142]|uniref:hypothetical protein n=1 Tax=Pantoea sp. AS142 TaxID=3081292 RepID=UPI0030189282